MSHGHLCLFQIKNQVKECLHFPVDPIVLVVDDLAPDIDRKAGNKDFCDGSQLQVAGKGEFRQKGDSHIAEYHFQDHPGSGTYPSGKRYP